jgi:hypothetical protein
VPFDIDNQVDRSWRREFHTTYYDTKHTPDYSPLVVHFTKDRQMAMGTRLETTHPLYAFRDATAKNRLLNILQTRVIHASPMPILVDHPNAVCFSECIWGGLNSLADQYSPYAVVFSKRLIFEKGGGPALYIRGDTLQNLAGNIPESIKPLISPFDPEAVLTPGVPSDWLHEREWRLSCSLDFEYSDIQYVIVETIEDAIYFVNRIGDSQLPEEKLIPIEVHRTIKKAWGDQS